MRDIANHGLSVVATLALCACEGSSSQEVARLRDEVAELRSQVSACQHAKNVCDDDLDECKSGKAACDDELDDCETKGKKGE